MLCLGLAASACGYRFATGGLLPAGIQTVYAPMFLNHTLEPGVEAIFTEAFRSHLVRAGVAGGQASDARVQGEVVVFSGGPTVAGPDGHLASYRLFATAQLTLTQGGQVLARTSVSGSEDYLRGADILLSESNRQAALHRLAESLMKDAYERLASGL